MDGVDDADAAVEIARGYAGDECVGQLDEVVEAERDGDLWIVEFVTQTFSDVYEHRVRIAPTGNVASHERSKRGDE